MFIVILKQLFSNIIKNICKRKKIFLSCAVVLLLIVLCALIIVSEKNVTIVVDGKSKSVVTFKKTVSKFLKEQNIAVNTKDKLNVSVDSTLKSNQTIRIKKAVKINVELGGKKLAILSAEDNVSKMLSSEKIKLNPKDKIQPALETKLYTGLNINIIRVEQKKLVSSSSIDFGTEVQSDTSMPNTETRIVRDGESGKKACTYEVTYENGIEVSRVLISEAVTKNPINKIVAKGTLEVLPYSRGGGLYYRNVINVKATAYSSRGGLSGIGNTFTASGRKAARNPDGYSTIAVDPAVIPIGSKVYVEGYGLAIAADTGTAIKGNFIDVFFDTFGEACNWSVKYVKVYMLAN